MNNQKGFTLIELVVVIVILGILSAVAVPKFVDMQNDAKESAVEGARGAVKSAVSLIHAKWLAAGEVNSSGTATVDGGYVAAEGAVIKVDEWGYPIVDTTTNDGIMVAAGIADDFNIDANNNITRDGETVASSNNTTWHFTYAPATGASGPTISTVTQ